MLPLLFAQQIFTCLKSTIESLEKGVKPVQSTEQRDFVLLSLLLTLNRLHTFF